MTPRERWLAIVAGDPVDRIPTDYQATPEVTARLLRDLDCPDEESLWRRLHIDKRRFVESRWRREHHPDDPAADAWGVRFREIDYGTGVYQEPEHHPLGMVETVDQVDAFRWPDPDDFDYSVITRTLDDDDGYRPIHSCCCEPLLLYGYMRGLELTFEDLALRPRLAEAILQHIFDFFFEHQRRCFAAGRGRIDLTWVAEDLGSQTGPLLSLQMYRQFLLPNQIRMAALARDYGICVMYHTDGAARMFLPDLVDRVGIQMLNPIQWRCPGMDRRELVAAYADKIVFHGSIDNQQTLPHERVDPVVEEVRESVAIYRNARWICAPCHNIQPNTPTKNIVAMYETIHRYGANPRSA